MANQWFYTADEERKGPVSADDLKQLAEAGKLSPSDFVWKEGMDDWRPASQVKGLFADGTVTVQTDGTTKAPVAAKSGRPAVVRPGFWQIPYLVGAGLLVIAMFLPWWSITVAGDEKDFEKAFTKEETVREIPKFNEKNGAAPRVRTRRKPDQGKVKRLLKEAGWYVRNVPTLSVDWRKFPDEDDEIDIRGTIWGWHSGLGRAGAFFGFLLIPVAVTMLMWPAARRYSWVGALITAYVSLIYLVMTCLWYLETPGYNVDPVIKQGAHVGPYLALAAGVILLAFGVTDGILGTRAFFRSRAQSATAE